MSECVLISSSEYVITTPANLKKKQPLKSKEEIFHCSSTENAVVEILSKENPNIIAFGETHPQGRDDGTKKTTLKLFAEKILPLLAKHGYLDLVFDLLTWDNEADQAVASYLRGKMSFDELSKGDYIFPQDSSIEIEVKKLLEAAKELKVQIYGGTFSYNDPERYFDMLDPMLGLDPKVIAASLKKITQRTTQKILKLLKMGKTKIASYNGGRHNDIVEHSPIKGLNFGEFFKFKTRYKYTEVDLLSPELMAKGPHDEDYAYPEYERWLKITVPEKRVNLISRGNSSFTIIVPQNTLDR